MRPIARLRTELLASGLLQPLAGLLGVLIALFGGASLSRALVPFAAFAAALFLVQTATVSRWVVRRAADAPEPAPDARREATSGTLRRSAVTMALPVAAVLLVSVVDVELAAWVGGVPVGVGLADLVAASLISRQERARAVTAYRELGRSPFAGGRRPIYTVPRSARTLET